MTSEPTTAAGRALAESLRHVGGSEWVANRVQAIEAEARATADAELAAEKERVARLGTAIADLFGSVAGAPERALALLAETADAAPAAYDEARADLESDIIGIARVEPPLVDVLGKAERATAEPRWPSGPDAERQLAAALQWVLFGSKEGISDGDLADATALLAALQEKRDPR